MRYVTINNYSYTSSHKNDWDDFIDKSRNGTFLLKRDFMEYHADRFTDHSLMIYYKISFGCASCKYKRGYITFSSRVDLWGFGFICKGTL